MAKRRRDMPRLSDKHGDEVGSADEEEAADDEMKVKDGARDRRAALVCSMLTHVCGCVPQTQRQGYRVVKAHFKSSHCPVCSKEFVPVRGFNP